MSDDRRKGKKRGDRRKSSKEERNLYKLLFLDKKKKADALKIIQCYFDTFAKIYSLFEHDAIKSFPKLGNNAARNRFALVAVQMLVCSQSEDSRKAIKDELLEINPRKVLVKILKKEADYAKEHKGTPISDMFLEKKKQLQELLDSA
jgi:hypothetical protein